jgi:hypothetical protein
MSLICAENGRDIEYGTPLYSATRASLNRYCALSAEIVNNIPLPCRRTSPCAIDADGVDIHRATAGKNFNGSYAWSSFVQVDFLFSISEEDARKYLPKLVQMLIA